jgi:hypothetical protein
MMIHPTLHSLLAHENVREVHAAAERWGRAHKLPRRGRRIPRRGDQPDAGLAAECVGWMVAGAESLVVAPSPPRATPVERPDQTKGPS